MVFVDEAAEAIAALDVAGGQGGDRDRVSQSIRRSLAKALVRARLVVVADELGQHLLQMTPTEDQQVVEKLPPRSAHPPVPLTPASQLAAAPRPTHGPRQFAMLADRALLPHLRRRPPPARHLDRRRPLPGHAPRRGPRTSSSAPPPRAPGRPPSFQPSDRAILAVTSRILPRPAWLSVVPSPETPAPLAPRPGPRQVCRLPPRVPSGRVRK